MEYSFKDHTGHEFLIVGDEVKKTTVLLGQGNLPQHGPKCAVTVYRTNGRGYIATIEFHPGEGNQALPRAKPWGGIIPRSDRPNMESLEELKLELMAAPDLGTLPHIGVEEGVRKAVGKLFPPPPGPTVIR
jgi:hypothetical protein